jgi:putative FmdB family regulatory protein
MPTYEYMCTSCATPLEVVQSIHEPSLTDCPSCEDGRLRKVFGNVGVVFKGSGFYRTDSRSKSSATAPATPKAEAKKSSEGGSSSASSATSSSGGSTGASESSSSSTSKSPTPAVP